MRLRQILPWQKPRISRSRSSSALLSSTNTPPPNSNNTTTPNSNNSNSNSNNIPPPPIATPPPIVSPLGVTKKSISTSSTESCSSLLSSTALCPSSPRHKSKRPVKIQSPNKRRTSSSQSKSITATTTTANAMNHKMMHHSLSLGTSNSDLATIAFSTSASYNNIPDHVIITEDNSSNSNTDMEYRRHNRKNKKQHDVKKEVEEEKEEVDDEEKEERLCYLSDEEMAVHLQMEWNQEDYINEQKQYKEDQLKAFEIQRMEHMKLIQPSPLPTRPIISAVADAGSSTSSPHETVVSINQKKQQQTQQIMPPPPPLPQKQQRNESLSSLSSSFLEIVRTTSSNANIPKNIIREQEKLFQHYKVDRDKAYELYQKEEMELKQFEENEMKSTLSGHAILLCNKVTEVLDEIKLKYPQFFNTKKISSLVTDDMLHFAEQFINTYQQYLNLGYNSNELQIDISYHYTSKNNINTIKTFGLLNATERVLYQINPIRSTGLVFGDGIYTSNNPFVFHKKYGSIGLMIATIKGKIVCYRNRAQLEELNHNNITNMNGIKTYNTLRGNKKKFVVKQPPAPAQPQPQTSSSGRSVSTISDDNNPPKLVRSNSSHDGDINTNDTIKRRRKRSSNMNNINNNNTQQQQQQQQKKNSNDNTNDYYDYLYEEDVIQTSMQCLPLISYDSSIIQSLILLHNSDNSTTYENNLGNCCIIELQEKLQNVLNNIFLNNNDNYNHNDMKCSPPPVLPKPTVNDLSFSSSMRLSSNDWNNISSNKNHNNATVRLSSQTTTKYIPLCVIEAVPSYLSSSIPSLSSDMTCHSYDDITDDDTIPIIEVAYKIMMHQEKMEQMLIYTTTTSKPRNNMNYYNNTNKHHFIETEAPYSSGDYKTDMDNDLLLSNIECNSKLNNHRRSSVT